MRENKQPILSICIPTYNRKKFLMESLNKILAQLNNNELLNSVEIVISDNDSKDGTGNLVRNIGSNNIKYFKNDYNIGGLANLYKVTEHAKGKYLWLLADDDHITNFAIKYVLDIIKAENFDLLLCNMVSSENMDVEIKKQDNEYQVFQGMKSVFLCYMRKNYKGYKNLISFFSFYSILIVKTDYFRKGLLDISQEIEGNDFPHEMIVYHSLNDKKIVIPNNVFVIGRLLNEGYIGSVKLIKTFNECLDFIEKRNNLSDSEDWKYIKRVCKNGWTKNIILGMIVGKLHINYKSNKFLKKIYYFYKKWLQ